MRISRVALNTGDGEIAVHRPATADFYHIAHDVWAGWLADQAVIHPFTLGLHPIEKCDGAILRWAFFIAGDGQNNRTVRWAFFDKVDCGSGKSCNARFHISGPPAIKKPVAILCAKRIDTPSLEISDGHNIGVTIEAKGFAFAPTGKEIGHLAAIHPRALKSMGGQKSLQKLQSAALLRGNAGAANEVCGQDRRINHQCTPFGECSKKGVICATTTLFSSKARCIKARSSSVISWPSSSRSSKLP